MTLPTTIPELQAEVQSLQTKLANSQQGRADDAKAAEEKLTSELLKQSNSLKYEFEAVRNTLQAEKAEAVKDAVAKALESHAAAAAEEAKAAAAALENAKVAYEGKLERAATEKAELQRQLNDARAETAKHKADAQNRYDAIFAGLRHLTDAEQKLRNSVRE